MSCELKRIDYTVDTIVCRSVKWEYLHCWTDISNVAFTWRYNAVHTKKPSVLCKHNQPYSTYYVYSTVFWNRRVVMKWMFQFQRRLKVSCSPGTKWLHGTLFATISKFMTKKVNQNWGKLSNLPRPKCGTLEQLLHSRKGKDGAGFNIQF